MGGRIWQNLKGPGFEITNLVSFVSGKHLSRARAAMRRKLCRSDGLDTVGGDGVL